MTAWIPREKPTRRPPQHRHRQDEIAVPASDVYVPEDVVSDIPDEIARPIELLKLHVGPSTILSWQLEAAASPYADDPRHDLSEHNDWDAHHGDRADEPGSTTSSPPPGRYTGTGGVARQLRACLHPAQRAPRYRGREPDRHSPREDHAPCTPRAPTDSKRRSPRDIDGHWEH